MSTNGWFGCNQSGIGSDKLNIGNPNKYILIKIIVIEIILAMIPGNSCERKKKFMIKFFETNKIYFSAKILKTRLEKSLKNSQKS